MSDSAQRVQVAPQAVGPPARQQAVDRARSLSRGLESMSERTRERGQQNAQGQNGQQQNQQGDGQQAGLKEAGAVYLNAIGGAAQFYARTITKVHGVSLLEFGTPEAMWHLELENFPAIVTMDAHGGSLHAVVEKASAAELAGIGA